MNVLLAITCITCVLTFPEGIFFESCLSRLMNLILLLRFVVSTCRFCETCTCTNNNIRFCMCGMCKVSVSWSTSISRLSVKDNVKGQAFYKGFIRSMFLCLKNKVVVWILNVCVSFLNADELITNHFYSVHVQKSVLGLAFN